MSLLFETKTRPSEVDADQLREHLPYLDDEGADAERLVVLTPDYVEPRNQRRSSGVGEFRRLSLGNRLYRDQDIIQKASEDPQVGCDGISDGGVPDECCVCSRTICL